MEYLTPPPIRRIVIDDPPTVVGPPVSNGDAGASTGTLAPMVQRRHVAPAEVVEDRMMIENVSIAYAGKPAVKNVTLPVRRGEVLALIGRRAAARRRCCARSTASPS